MDARRVLIGSRRQAGVQRKPRRDATSVEHPLVDEGFPIARAVSKV